MRQLAEQYLSRREEELGIKVDPDERPRELQKVKAHIALHQVYGVDLNATAVELAEVSLWLDTMVAGLQAPWFGLRLRRGNSLVGARRALYDAHQIRDRSWLTTPPQDEPLTSLAALIDDPDASTSSLATRVHHFLLPAQGWGSAVEVPKVVRDLVPDSRLKALKAWRTGVRRKPTNPQIKRLQALAERVETLWGLALRRLRMAEAESSRAIDIWGRETPSESRAVSREEIAASLADRNGAYRRLRLVMDAWCVLWYWPLTEFEIEPPTVDQWLDACEAILGKPDLHPKRRKATQQASLAQAVDWAQLGEAEELDLGFAGAQRLERIRVEHDWLAVCERAADEQAFFHWELDFAAVFADGGFDLQLGNPPWVRPTVDVEALLADGDPWWALALKPSEAAKDDRRGDTLRLPGMCRTVVDGTSEVAVTAELLSDTNLYPLLSGQPDLYRAFMCAVWSHASEFGISGLFTWRLTSPTTRRRRCVEQPTDIYAGIGSLLTSCICSKFRTRRPTG